MRNKIGPYAEYYQDAMAATKGKNMSLMPRTYGDLHELNRVIGKATPGMDFFKNTKAKNFAGVLDELRSQNKLNKSPGIKNQMELAKSNANNRSPLKAGK